MSGETWIAGVSAVAAIAAAGGAIWQAAQARQSARSAATDERKAEAAATRAAAAGERMALALEESNAMERARGQKPRWHVSVQAGRTTDIIRVTNQGANAYDVSAEILGAEPGFGHSDTFPAEVLEAGLSGTVRLLKYGGMAADRVLQVEWRDEPGGEVQTAKVTT